MSEELSVIEQKREELRQRIEKAQQDLLSMAEDKEMSLKQAPRKRGYVEAQTLDELRMALEISREIRFSRMTDEWIDFEIEHEKEHIEKAKEIYGEDVPHSYGIQFLELEGGEVALVPMYRVVPPAEIDEGTFLKNSVAITEAPKHQSDGDNDFLESQPTPPSNGHRGQGKLDIG